MPQHRDGQHHEEGEERGDMDTPQPLVPRVQRRGGGGVDECRQRIADERPLLERRPSFERDPHHLGREAGDGEDEEHAEDDRVLGLRLDADAIRTLHVAPSNCPADAGEEQDARRVADRSEPLVHAAVEELRALGHLVVDLEHRRDAEQDEEAEVDHRVHDARRGSRSSVCMYMPAWKSRRRRPMFLEVVARRSGAPRS